MLDIANNIADAPEEELQAAQEMDDATNRIVQVLEQQLFNVEVEEDAEAVRIVRTNVAAEVRNLRLYFCSIMW